MDKNSLTVFPLFSPQTDYPSPFARILSNFCPSIRPPSLDLIQKSERAKDQTEQEQKKKPGGQPGHPGKTRKGFGRVDRYEISQPETCQWCALRVTRHAGSRELSEAISLQTQQVACLIAQPIEVVEYQTRSCKCLECGGIERGSVLGEASPRHLP